MSQSTALSLYDTAYFQRMAIDNFEFFKLHRGRRLLPDREAALALIQAKPGQTVLDLGCGRGEMVMFLATQRISGVGVDSSRAALELGRQCQSFFSPTEQRLFRLIEGDVCHLDLPDSSFDRVMSWATAEHLDSEQFRSYLREIHRLLQPDGIAVIGDVPNALYEEIGYVLIRPVKQLFVQRPLPTVAQMKASTPEHVNVISPVSFAKEMRKIGFACHVELLPRPSFEKGGAFAIVGYLLERLPLLRMLFCPTYVVIGAKTKSALTRFRKTAQYYRGRS